MIELKQVTKQYGQATVLKNITLTVDEPGIYCLLGRNGAGKTTLLKSIAGYQNITSGSIQVDGKTAVITGVKSLNPAPVRAVDLRAGAAMIIAGLAANGTTEIEEIDHIDRGYENVVEKFSALGADIKRVPVFDTAPMLKQA